MECFEVVLIEVLKIDINEEEKNLKLFKNIFFLTFYIFFIDRSIKRGKIKITFIDAKIFFFYQNLTNKKLNLMNKKLHNFYLINVSHLKKIIQIFFLLYQPPLVFFYLISLLIFCLFHFSSLTFLEPRFVIEEF